MGFLHEKAIVKLESAICIVQDKLKAIAYEKNTPYENEFTNISEQELHTILAALNLGKMVVSLD